MHCVLLYDFKRVALINGKRWSIDFLRYYVDFSLGKVDNEGLTISGLIEAGLSATNETASFIDLVIRFHAWAG